MKEERIRIAKEINKINNQLMNLGEWDREKTKELNQKKEELEAQRIATFKGMDEYIKFKEELKASGKPRWSGAYTEVFGYGAICPREEVKYPTGQTETVYGWPEWYTDIEPEWQMRFDTERLEQAEKEEKTKQNLEAEVAKLKEAWGINKKRKR